MARVQFPTWPCGSLREALFQFCQLAQHPPPPSTFPGSDLILISIFKVEANGIPRQFRSKTVPYFRLTCRNLYDAKTLSCQNIFNLAYLPGNRRPAQPTSCHDVTQRICTVAHARASESPELEHGRGIAEKCKSKLLQSLKCCLGALTCKLFVISVSLIVAGLLSSLAVEV